MNIQVLKNLLVKRRINKAGLARLAGVSRAAVTQWFRKGEANNWINIETSTLQKLAQGLKVSSPLLLSPGESLNPLKTRFLWDNLYPDMESFVKALSEKRKPALARLVQVIGFHSASHVMGKKIVVLFPTYKKFIHPLRRKQLETIWPLYSR